MQMQTACHNKDPCSVLFCSSYCLFRAPIHQFRLGLFLHSLLINFDCVWKLLCASLTPSQSEFTLLNFYTQSGSANQSRETVVQYFTVFYCWQQTNGSCWVGSCQVNHTISSLTIWLHSCTCTETLSTYTSWGAAGTAGGPLTQRQHKISGEYVPTQKSCYSLNLPSSYFRHFSD